MKKEKRLTTSLIVPVYNEADYLPRLINSISVSTEEPDEILFCDNDSTDASIDVITKNTQHMPVRILKEHAKGILHVVNRLWKAAQGDIILKVDADSVLPEMWIQNTRQHFEDDSKLSACTGPIIPADGSEFDKIIVGVGYKAALWSYEKMRGFPLLSGPNSAFRKRMLLEINGYDWPKHDLDDQIISKKMNALGKKTKFYQDMYLYHSTRRYQNRPMAYIETIISVFDPKYYTEK